MLDTPNDKQRLAFSLPGRAAFARLSRALARRARWLALAGLFPVTVVALSLVLRPTCGCALPPVPNLSALEAATHFLKEGDYRLAASTFDQLLHDENSAAIHAEALYGRGLSERGLGVEKAADADLAEARRLKSYVAMQFAAYSGAAR